jgi:threonine dehydratase
MLDAALDARVWVKLENRAPLGAFEVGGGLVYFHDLAADWPKPAGVICATRGNHGHSVAFTARRCGLPAT